MEAERIFHFTGVDVVAATDDQFLGPSDNAQVTGLVDNLLDLVAGRAEGFADAEGCRRWCEAVFGGGE